MTPSSDIENALLVQPLDKRVDFGFDAGGVDRRKLRLQIRG